VACLESTCTSQKRSVGAWRSLFDGESVLTYPNPALRREKEPRHLSACLW